MDSSRVVQMTESVSYLDQNEQDFRSKRFGLVQTELHLIYQVVIHREILAGQLDNCL